MSKVARHIYLAGATGTVRLETYQGRQHYVLPVIALVEGVIQGMNSPTPELVLAEELEVAPAGWNGEPVLTQHPVVDGEPVSANSPRVLERYQVGRVFNSRVVRKKLKMEAWIDPELLEQVGDRDNAESLVERFESGEMIEVSVGAFIVVEEASGEHEGVPYGAIWRSITPDHLALLPEGVIGACSNEMGCGTPRAAQLQVLTESGKILRVPSVNQEDPMPGKVKKEKDEGRESPTPKRTLKDRLLAMLPGFRDQQEGVSDNELRGALWDALRAEEPGFDTVVDVFQEDGEVIYLVMPEDEWLFFKRSFTLNEDGTVTLGADRVEVEAKTVWEEVSAASSGGGCSCGNQPAQGNKGDETMAKGLKERVAALIANKRSPFTDEDKKFLEGLSEDRLKAFEEAAEEQAEEPQGSGEPSGEEPSGEKPTGKEKDEEEELEPAVASAKKKQRDVVEVPKEEWAEVKALAEERKAEKKARRKHLIDGIIEVSDAYSEDDRSDLEALEMKHLERIAKVVEANVEPMDYSGRGIAREREQDKSVPKPPSIHERLEKKRTKAS